MKRPGNPVKILQLRFHLEDLLSSARSITGSQLDMLAQGRSPRPADGAAPDPQANLRILLSDLLTLCKDMTPEEVRVARLRFGSDRAPTEFYDRLVRADEVQAQQWGEVRTMGTSQGEEMLDEATAPGVKLVRGRRATWLPWALVAEASGLTERQARRRIDDATDKVRQGLSRHAAACKDDARECNLCRMGGAS